MSSRTHTRDVPPYIGDCVRCGNLAEGYPVPVLHKDGSFLTTRHLCLSCWFTSTHARKTSTEVARS
jgi:hypothetical protein